MLCPKCGSDCGDVIRLCPVCEEQYRRFEEMRSPKASRKAEPVDGEEEVEAEAANVNLADAPYAGFWIRLCALLVDSLILTLPVNAAMLVFSATLETVLGAILRGVGEGKLSGNWLIGIVVGMLFALLGVMLVYAVVGGLYFVLFEISPLRGTPGKKFAGLVVTDLEGERLSFFRATLRYISKIVSTVPFLLGFALAGFTQRKQGLHDIIAGTTVRKAESRPPALLFVVGIVSALMLYMLTPNKSVSVTSTRQEVKTEPKQLPVNKAPAPPPNKEAFANLAKDSPAVEPATPAPTPEIEIPEKFSGPHSRIRSHSSVIDAQSVIAFYYPANNSVAVGFYPEKLEAADIETVKKRGVLASAGNRARPIMTIYLEFDRDAREMSKENLRAYTVNFYQNAMIGFGFKSANDAVSLSKNREQLAGEKIEISGQLAAGTKLKLGLRGKGAPKAMQALQFRWDIERDVVVFPSK